MDDQLAVPGPNIRFGLDTIVGLFPVGDAVTSVISLSDRPPRLAERRLEAHTRRMLGSVGIDFLVGSVPVVGDFFDVA